MNIEIKLIESVNGNKPSEQIDFLICKMERETKNIVAYLKGNGYIKLFTYQDFIDWYAYEKEVTSIDIEQKLYDTDRPFERFVMEEVFGKTLPKEDLMFTFRGNGIGVCDRLREEHRDYMSVAHISYEREVTYYKEVSPEGKATIEKYAKENNVTPVSQLHMHALKPLEI